MIKVQEIGSKSLVWSSGEVGLQQILAGKLCYYMLGNTNKLSVLFQLSSGFVVTLERNILLRLRCNED